MSTADRIKERRLAMGLTQEELGEKLGLQKSAIAKYENGRVENIKKSTIKAMAKVLECRPSYLLDADAEYELDDLKPIQLADPDDIRLLMAYHNAPESRQEAVRTLLDMGGD